MVKISELPLDWSVTGTEELVLRDGSQTKRASVDTVLAKQHNHTASDVTDFNSAVDARINVPTDTAKTTPVDTDVFALWDTIRKKVTWANIKATLKTYFDTLYHTKNALRTGLTANQIMVTDWSGVEWYSALSLLPVVASDAEATAGTNETKFINSKQLKNRLFIPNCTASSNLKYSADTQRLFTYTSAYTLVKSIKINLKWAVRTSFELRWRNFWWYPETQWRIYINWVAVWTVRQSVAVNTRTSAFTEDVNVNPWDFVQLYCYTANGSWWQWWARNFRLLYDITQELDWIVTTD